MGLGYQAANVKFPEYRSTDPHGDAVAYSGCILYTTDTTHKVNEIPERFHGRFVRITAFSGDLHFAFTDLSTLEIDRSLAATDAGTENQKLGGFLAQDQFREGRIPTAPIGGKVYFARESSATGTVLIEITSD